MSITERIQYLANLKKLTFASIERSLSFGNGTIRKWDTNSPSIDKLNELANFLNVSIEWLVTGEGAMYKHNEENTDEAEPEQLSVEEKLLLENYRDMPERYKLELQKRAARMAVDSEQPSSNSTTTDGEEAATIENRVG